MSSSAAAFSGSVPTFYDRYLGPVLFEPYATDLVSRIPAADDGLRVLELACGTGILTRRLREALPEASIVATDLNQAMIDYARAAVAAPGIIWQQADAQELAFEDGSFDVVVCQFGFMFLPDKVRGFREARRVLRAEGVLLANVWRSMEANPAAAAIHASLATLFPADPPLFMETPYGYYDTERIRADMAEAGWKDAQLEDVSLRSFGPSAADFATGFTRGSPLTHELAQRGADPDEVARVLTDVLVPVGGERPFEPSLAAVVISAVR